MSVGEFVQLEDMKGKVCVVNTAQISIIEKREQSWQVRLMDGNSLELTEQVAQAFMSRLTGMPVIGDR